MSGETWELEVCTDCLIWVANYDCSGMDDETYSRVVAGAGEWSKAGVG